MPAPKRPFDGFLPVVSYFVEQGHYRIAIHDTFVGELMLEEKGVPGYPWKFQPSSEGASYPAAVYPTQRAALMSLRGTALRQKEAM